MRRLLSTSATLGALLLARPASAQVIEPIQTIQPVVIVIDSPTTPGYTGPAADLGYDLRYWKPLAASAFRTCMSSSLPILSVCMRNARDNNGGDPCLAPTATMCTTMDYYVSWCGRGAYSANRSNLSWTCRTEMRNAAQRYLPGPNTSSTQRAVVLPDLLLNAAGASTRHYMERAQGYVTEPPATAYSDIDSYRPDLLQSQPTSVFFSAPILFATIDPRIAWAANGNRVDSCDEYAYERYYDFHRIDDLARVDRRNMRLFVDSVFQVRTGPFRNPSGSINWGLHDKAGGDLPKQLPSDMLPSNPNTYVGQYGDRRVIKNVYQYIDGLARPPVSSLFPNSMVFGFHHYPTLEWHFVKARDTRAAGWLDEELENLRDKQDLLWDKWKRWGAMPAGAAKDAARAEIDALMEDGRRAGCITPDNTTLTACDWAPSLLYDDFNKGMIAGEKKARLRCLEYFPDNVISNSTIRAKYTYIATHLPPALGTIDVSRELAYDYQADADNVESYYRDMAFLLDDLRYLLSKAGGAGRVLKHTGRNEKTSGNEWFGTSAQSLESGGIDPDDLDICHSRTAYDGRNVATAKVFTVSKKAFDDHLALVDDQPHQDLEFGGTAVFVPGSVVAGRFSASYSFAEHSFPLLPAINIPAFEAGIFRLSFRLGAAFSWGAGASVSVTGLGRPSVPAATGCSNGTMSITGSSNLHASVGGYIGGAIGFGPIAVGVKGGINVVEATLAFSAQLALDFHSGGATARGRLSLDLDGAFMSGYLAIFIAVDAVFVSIPVFEVVIARFGGLLTGKLRILDTDLGSGVDPCLVAELETLAGGLRTRLPTGCVKNFP